jgi:hypothetical protein
MMQFQPMTRPGGLQGSMRQAPQVGGIAAMGGDTMESLASIKQQADAIMKAQKDAEQSTRQYVSIRALLAGLGSRVPGAASVGAHTPHQQRRASARWMRAARLGGGRCLPAAAPPPFPAVASPCALQKDLFEREKGKVAQLEQHSKSLVHHNQQLRAAHQSGGGMQHTLPAVAHGRLPAGHVRPFGITGRAAIARARPPSRPHPCHAVLTPGPACPCSA